MGSWLPFCRHCTWFTKSLRGTENDNIYFYKMSFRFCHQVTGRENSSTTWRENSTTTKWVLVFTCFYRQVTWREHPGATKWILAFYMFLHVFSLVLLEGNTPPLQNELWKWLEFQHVPTTCCTPRTTSFCPDPPAPLPQAVIPTQERKRSWNVASSMAGKWREYLRENWREDLRA